MIILNLFDRVEAWRGSRLERFRGLGLRVHDCLFVWRGVVVFVAWEAICGNYGNEPAEGVDWKGSWPLLERPAFLGNCYPDPPSTLYIPYKPPIRDHIPHLVVSQNKGTPI